MEKATEEPGFSVGQCQSILEWHAKDDVLRAIGRYHRILSSGETWPGFVLGKTLQWRNECT